MLESLLQLTLVAGLVWGIYPLINKFIIESSTIPFGTLTLLFYFFVGIIALIGLKLGKFQLLTDIKKLSVKHWIMLIVSALIFLIAGYSFNYSSVKFSPYKTLAFSIAFGSIASMIVSFYLFNINISMIELATMVIIISGIYILNAKQQS
jgi:drug/metabolite transporter (DMT)-like permease